MKKAFIIVLWLFLGGFTFLFTGFPFLISMALSNSGGSNIDYIWFWCGIIFSIFVACYFFYLFKTNEEKKKK